MGTLGDPEDATGIVTLSSHCLTVRSLCIPAPGAHKRGEEVWPRGDPEGAGPPPKATLRLSGRAEDDIVAECCRVISDRLNAGLWARANSEVRPTFSDMIPVPGTSLLAASRMSEG